MKGSGKVVVQDPQPGTPLKNVSHITLVLE